MQRVRMGLLLSYKKTPRLEVGDSKVSSCPNEAIKDQALPSFDAVILCVLVMSPVTGNDRCHSSKHCVLTRQNPSRKGRAQGRELSLTLSPLMLRRKS